MVSAGQLPAPIEISSVCDPGLGKVLCRSWLSEWGASYRTCLSKPEDGTRTGVPQWGPGDLAWPMRGWRNTVEIVQFEISNSMKPYPSVLHAYTSQLRPAIGFVEPNKLDKFNRIPPTSQPTHNRGSAAGLTSRCSTGMEERRSTAGNPKTNE